MPSDEDWQIYSDHKHGREDRHSDNQTDPRKMERRAAVWRGSFRHLVMLIVARRE